MNHPHLAKGDVKLSQEEISVDVWKKIENVYVHLLSRSPVMFIFTSDALSMELTCSIKDYENVSGFSRSPL